MPHLPAISCLGAFQTPASERVAGLVIAGVRKPAQKRTYRPLASRNWCIPTGGSPLFDAAPFGAKAPEASCEAIYDRTKTVAGCGEVPL